MRGEKIARRLIAKAPPGWGEAAMQHLKRQYPGEPDKAFATAWSLHGRGVSGEEYMEGKSSSAEAPDREAVSPPGWGGTVEHMKEHKEISNPWSLSWWMSKQKKPGGGKKFHPHYKEKKKRKKKGGKEMSKNMLDEIVTKVCQPMTDRIAKRKTVKQRARGTSVFQSTHPKVKDNKDHFPIGDLAHARNALARVMQYDSVPSWYNGTLGGLQSAVKRAIYKKFPGLKSRKEEREG